MTVINIGHIIVLLIFVYVVSSVIYLIIQLIYFLIKKKIFGKKWFIWAALPGALFFLFIIIDLVLFDSRFLAHGFM